MVKFRKCLDLRRSRELLEVRLAIESLLSFLSFVIAYLNLLLLVCFYSFPESALGDFGVFGV